jgi:hypothetical protein
MYRSTFDPPEFNLTEAEAFAAMRCFLERFLKSAGNDMYTLLGDIFIRPSDGVPTDPAAWTDWLSCVAEVKGLEAPDWRTVQTPKPPNR